MNLVGRSVTIFGMAKNLQTIEITLDDGTFLGVMTCEPRWAESPHSLDVRREIIRRENDGSFVCRGSDIVKGFKRHLESEAKSSKRSARWLAKMEIEQRHHSPSQDPDIEDTEADSVFEKFTDGDESFLEDEPDELNGLNTVYRK